MGLDALVQAFGDVLGAGSLLYLVGGVFLGLLFGLIPGLGGTTALALLMPMTFSMNALDAMYLSGGVMGATTFGGSITAILLNTPGTAPNAATTFDGYPLARQGKAGLAIGASATASALGGLLGLLTLLLFIPVAREVVLSFGPAEFFLLTILGLAAIAVSLRGKLLRGLIAGCVGLLFAFVGQDAISGDLRFTMDIDYLWDGIPLVPTLTGMFAISQMIELGVKGGSVASANPGADDKTMRITGVFDGVLAVFRHWPTLIRGSVIGTLIGAIPGLGGTVAAFVAYSSAVQTDRDPDSYGKGNIKGVIAPEAANNAKDGGSLIPTVAFGIPGSAETALFLGILVLHGMDPGPGILLYHQREIYGLIVALTVSAVGASLVGLALSRLLVLVTRIEVGLVIPVVVAVSLTGIYVLNGRMADVLLTVLMGLLGYLMIRFDYPRLTLVIALVLGETAENSLHQLIMISDGHPVGFMMARPVSIVLIVATVVTFLMPTLRRLRAMRRGWQRSGV
ncbi:Tripartite tricarboxylate transporter TctA family protein [Hartmannibacter diazotrophicus]|uniref:Tripartite tricarboxylate transporter TctA family protein n=1 Tax=Hartmannibacter diazotrophicus TaxID=1482074 RepID=A0A2C9DBQ1_9HYPH|nr:tripartite tricarboxylate transporter permease [Hartmannibacter diazotrophicus]SON57762.1 Tripartite tricarboxylate transporter TctA family protein [Hartmannibacter diazotrophicus]